MALEAEKHERPGSSELACIGDTEVQIFLSDKDTHEKAVYGNIPPRFTYRHVSVE